MKNKIKRILAQMFLTHLGRITMVAIPLMIIGGLMSPNGVIGENFYYDVDRTTVFEYMMFTGLIILLIEFIIGMYWALKNTINDIKDWLKNKKK